jgi:hypothetical protein
MNISSIAVSSSLEQHDRNNPMAFEISILPDQPNFRAKGDFRHQHIGDLSGFDLYDWIKSSLHGLCRADGTCQLNVPKTRKDVRWDDGKGVAVCCSDLRLFIYGHHVAKSVKTPSLPGITDAMIEVLAQSWRQQVDNWYTNQRNCYDMFLKPDKGKHTPAQYWRFCNIARRMETRIYGLEKLSLGVQIDFGPHEGLNRAGWFDCEGVLGATQWVLEGLRGDIESALHSSATFRKSCNL